MRLQAGAIEPDVPVAFTFGSVSLSCLLGESHADFAETGQVVWPGASLLAHFLLSPRGRSLTQKAHVVELGAGVGIPGLLAAREGGAERLVLTDHNSKSIELLEGNVRLNAAAGETDVSVAMLDWEDIGMARGLGKFGVVLGADVVYSVASAPVLLRAAESLLSADDGSCIVLAYVSRWPQVDAALVEAADKLGLSMVEVPSGEFLSDGEVAVRDEACLGDSAIYIVTRRGQSCSAITEWMGKVEVSEAGEMTVTASEVAAGILEGGQAISGDAVRMLTVKHSGALTLTRGGCEAVSAAMARWGGGLVSLRLEGQRIGAESAECLVHGIALCTGLTCLALPGSCVGSKGIKGLCHLLSGRSGGGGHQLRELDVGGNGIGDEGLTCLNDLLGMGEMRRLLLSLNRMTDSGIAALSKHLPETLEALDLSSNAVSSQGVEALMLQATLLPNLTSLDLSFCALYSQGAEALANGMKHMHKLSSLRLRSCWLSDDGVIEISIGMPLCPLRELDLSSNGVGCLGACSLAEALGELTQSPQEDDTLSLVLQRNSIQGEGAKSLVHASGTCAVGVVVDIKDNPLGEEGGLMLVQDLSMPFVLPERGARRGRVELSACGIGDTEGEELQHAWGVRGVQVNL